MKTHTKQIPFLTVMICIYVTFFNSAIAQQPQPHSQRTKNQQDFSVYGKKLKAKAQNSASSGGLKHGDEQKINDLAKHNSPLFTMVNRGAVTASGIGFKGIPVPGQPDHYDRTNPELVLLDSLSGEPVNKCRTSSCGIGAITQGNPHDALILSNALSASKKPISMKREVKIKVNGQDKVVVKDVTYFVVIKAVYDGSYCDTTYSGGFGYQTCYTRRTRTR